MAGFFSPEQAALLEPLRKSGAEAQREALREVVRITDRAFLDRLIALDIGAEKALALRLIPLVFVAWADGVLDERERAAFLQAAGERGLAADKAGRAILEVWLASKPDPRLLTAWKGEVRRVWNRFTSAEQWQMRQNLLGSARDVAEAAGGILGLISISAVEKAVLKDLESVLD